MKSDRRGDVFGTSRFGSDGDDDYLGFAGREGDFRSLSQIRRVYGNSSSQSQNYENLQPQNSFAGRDSNVAPDYSQSAPYVESILRPALARSSEIVNGAENPYAENLQPQNSFAGRDSNVAPDYSQSAPYVESILRPALARSSEIVNGAENPYAENLQPQNSFAGRDSNVAPDYSQSAPYVESILRPALARSSEVVNGAENPYIKGSGSEYNGSLDDLEIARLIKSEKQARRELEALKGMKDNSQEFIDKSAEKNAAEDLYKARKKFMKLVTPITAPARFGFNLASIGTLMGRSFGIGINNKIEIREDGEKKSYTIRELLAQDENGKPKYESLPVDTMQKISQKIESKQKTRNTVTSFAFGLLAIATFAVGIASFATGLAPIGIAMGALGGAMFAGFMGLNAVRIARQKSSGIKEDLENASKQIVADGVNLAKTKEEVQELAAKDKMARYSPRNTMREQGESAIRPEAKNSIHLSHVDRLSNSKTLSNEKSARVAERW